MKHPFAAFHLVPLLLAACLSSPAGAVVTHAYSYADAGNLDSAVQQSQTAGAEGARATAAQGVVSHAQAGATPGSVRASGAASGGGYAQVRANASWSDSFPFRASGYAPGDTGTFDFGMTVQGGLLAEFVGRSYADVYVVATYSIDTGLPGGRGSWQGGGRRTVGYDIGSVRSGEESFWLGLQGVPFEFDRDIHVSMALSIVGVIDSLNPESSAQAEAAYGQSMHWAGLTNVRDASGRLVQDFSAVSPSSGYDFVLDNGGPTPVPEPASGALVAAGLLALRCIRKRSDRR